MNKEHPDNITKSEVTTTKARENTLKYFIGIAFAIAIIEHVKFLVETV